MFWRYTIGYDNNGTYSTVVEARSLKEVIDMINDCEVLDHAVEVTILLIDDTS